jgi:LDH2 family malate/lactate/ureidoglycolate dehydrogenase
MVGITISNSTPVMAAWGGCGSAIGNNPISIAAPYRSGRPLVLDIAMSRVAGGKVRLAARNGEKIPRGWIIDSRGRDTENPDDLPNGGALLPLGEHKGFAFAVMIEVLGAVITGSGMLGQIPFWVKDTRSPLNIGHAFIAIDIGSLMEPEEYYQRVEWMVDTLKNSALAEHSSGIFMPGELEWQIEEERKTAGIPITPEVWEDLEGVSRRYDEPLRT